MSADSGDEVKKRAAYSAREHAAKLALLIASRKVPGLRGPPSTPASRIYAADSLARLQERLREQLEIVVRHTWSARKWTPNGNTNSMIVKSVVLEHMEHHFARSHVIMTPIPDQILQDIVESVSASLPHLMSIGAQEVVLIVRPEVATIVETCSNCSQPTENALAPPRPATDAAARGQGQQTSEHLSMPRAQEVHLADVPDRKDVETDAEKVAPVFREADHELDVRLWDLIQPCVE